MHNQPSPSQPNDPSASFVTQIHLNAAHSHWLTSAEAAQYINVKARTILFWAPSGKIKAYPMAGTKRRVWRFLESDLADILIHSRPVISSAQPSVLESGRSI